MKARFWGRVVDGRFSLGAATNWHPYAKEQRAAIDYLKLHTSIQMEISLRDDGKLEVRERDKKTKIYPDEDTLRVMLELKGVKFE